jgi:hypothetical protein
MPSGWKLILPSVYEILIVGFHEAAFTTSVVSVDDAAISVVEDAAVVSDDPELLEHALRRIIDRAAAMLRLDLIFMDRFLA